ncbi:unnamed protein product [Lactuca virosa]|uniref:Phospholipid-transporting ATPase n=1 Tax=Lactuca virosa TaxID=75947 RepID=A0AAU9PM59_9ASTR|nr:unnamed protein product [Lactuca virosa]
MHEFGSESKRMSVILGFPDNSVKVFVKGADTTLFNVIDKSMDSDIVKATKSHLHSYSSVGLRTLVMGIRELNSHEFNQWRSSYESATSALMGRARLLKKVAINLETNLNILGASGIEDKLQEGVPEAIESLRTAGIKVWVLTGDKQETAISIGYSSKLLTNTMTQIVINNNSTESCRKSLSDALIRSRKSDSSGDDSRSIALIIDGTSLVYILDTELEEQLFELASKCVVVLCCRVAPLQKVGIVMLIKKRTDDLTLAIGDGSNDVSMIQKADVGIGISGQEGRQAMMSSDFAMAQFRFLVPLLLVHGHWNYQRMGYMILYNFYRNAVFVLVLFWGNEAYKSGDLSEAEVCYSKGISSIQHIETPGVCIQPLLLCYNNRAAIRMALGRMREDLNECRMAVALDPNFMKVNLRSANCYLLLGEVDDASYYYNKCLESEEIICLDRRIIIEAAKGLQKAQNGRFSGGFDINVFQKVHKTGDISQLPDVSVALVTNTIEDAKKPIVAVVQGLALGGGLELAMGCHACVAAPRAQLGLPKFSLGVMTGFGDTQRLPRLLGLSKGIDMMLTSKPILSEEGEKSGVLKEVKVFNELVVSDTSKGLVHIFFAQRAISKVPKVTDVGLKLRSVKKVDVIGGGLMGSGIATALILGNIKVVLKEVNSEYLQKGIKTIEANVKGLVARKKLPQGQGEKALSLVNRVLDYSQFKDVDMVIEQKIFSEIENICPPHCILATNTSTIDLNLIGEKIKSQDRVIGAHFFSPAHVMPLLEIVRTEKTM